MSLGPLTDEQRDEAKELYKVPHMKNKHAAMYMRIAHAAAETSSAIRLKVGCCVVKNNAVLAVSYNALPSSIDGPLEDEVFDEFDCSTKLVTKPEVRHAEANALLALAKGNESSFGATMFVTHSCCKFCAIDIIDAGIKTVVYEEEYRDTTGLDYLRANGVKVIKFSKE